VFPEGVVCILSSVSVNDLGGYDLTDRLVDYCRQDFYRQYPNASLSSPYAMQRLRFSCQSARHELSQRMETNIHIPLFYEDFDYTCHLTRHLVDVLCADLYKRVIDCVRIVLEEAKLEVEHIHQLLLLGGAMRTATLRGLLIESFHFCRLNEFSSNDQIVANGAAMQAAIELGQAGDQVKKVWIEDVSHLSLGIDTAGDLMQVLIPRHTPLPCERSATFSTYDNQQTVVTIHLYEGERTRTTENRLIASLQLNGITPAPRGVPIIQVTVKIDRKGLVTLTAEEITNQKQQKTTQKNRLPSDTDAPVPAPLETPNVTIPPVPVPVPVPVPSPVRALSRSTVFRCWQSGLPPIAQHDLITQILFDAGQHQPSDHQHQQRIEAKNRLEQYLNGLQTLIQLQKNTNNNSQHTNNTTNTSTTVQSMTAGKGQEKRYEIHQVARMETDQHSHSSISTGTDSRTFTSLHSNPVISLTISASSQSTSTSTSTYNSNSNSNSSSSACGLSVFEIRLVTEVCDHISAWLAANSKANTQHYQRKLMEMELVCQPILKKIYTNPTTQQKNTAK